MLPAILVFVFTLLIYFLGLSSSVYGGDNGDIILAAWFGGIAHPPGYPLNSIIGWVFTHLPYQATVAFKANLVAAFFQAATIGVLFLILRRLTQNWVISLTTSLVLAFNPLFWLYAHVLEVFQLNLFLLATSFYFLLLWQSKAKNLRLLYIAVFVWGLAVFHHHTSILLAPAYFYFVRQIDKDLINRKYFFKFLGIFLLGLVQYIYAPIAAYMQTPINWDNPIKLLNLIQLITRADYGTFTAADFLAGGSLGSKVGLIANYFLFLKNDFNVLGVLMVILGAYYAFKRNKIIFYYVLLSVLISGPIFIFYSGFPTPDNFYTGLWERFLLTSYFFLALFVAYGLLFLRDKIVKPLSKTVKTKRFSAKYLAFLATCVFLLLPFYMYLINSPKTDLSNFKLGDWLGYDLLISTENDAAVFLFGDSTLFNSQYIYYTTDDFDDLKVIKGGSTSLLYYREQIEREFSDIVIPSDFTARDEKSSKYLADLITANAGNMPIFAEDRKSNIPGYEWVKYGLLYKLVPSSEGFSVEDYDERNREILSRFKYNEFTQNLGYTGFLDSHLKDPYYNSLIRIAETLIENEGYEEALYYLERATEIHPNEKGAYTYLGLTYLKLESCEKGINNLENSFAIDSRNADIAASLSAAYLNCYQDLEKAEEYRLKLIELAGQDELLE